MVVEGRRHRAHGRRCPRHGSHDEVGVVIEGEVKVIVAVAEDNARVARSELLWERIKILALLLLLGTWRTTSLKGDGERGVGRPAAEEEVGFIVGAIRLHALASVDRNWRRSYRGWRTAGPCGRTSATSVAVAVWELRPLGGMWISTKEEG